MAYKDVDEKRKKREQELKEKIGVKDNNSKISTVIVRNDRWNTQGNAINKINAVKYPNNNGWDSRRNRALNLKPEFETGI